MTPAKGEVARANDRAPVARSLFRARSGYGRHQPGERPANDRTGRWRWFDSIDSTHSAVSNDGAQAPPSQSSTARSSALMPTLSRVLASTRLTMTAQYRLYLPPADGRFPDTTTDPGGTRP